LPTRSPLTSNQSLPFAAQLGVDVGPLDREPHRTAALSLAPRRNANALTASTAHAAQSHRRRRSAIRIALTLVNNGDKQHAEHTSLAKLFFTVSCRGSV
jgi:hypothetical protein